LLILGLVESVICLPPLRSEKVEVNESEPLKVWVAVSTPLFNPDKCEPSPQNDVAVMLDALTALPPPFKVRLLLAMKKTADEKTMPPDDGCPPIELTRIESAPTVPAMAAFVPMTSIARSRLRMGLFDFLDIKNIAAGRTQCCG